MAKFRASKLRVFMNGVEVPGVDQMTYSSNAGDSTISISMESSNYTIVNSTMHKQDCTIDLNGVIDNEKTGPYIYCSCGIMLRCKATAAPFKHMVEELLAAGMGAPGTRDLAKVQFLRDAIGGQIELLTNLSGALDAYVNNETSELRDWACEDLDPDL